MHIFSVLAAGFNAFSLIGNTFYHFRRFYGETSSWFKK